jgi:hypothetical protein
VVGWREDRSREYRRVILEYVALLRRNFRVWKGIREASGCLSYLIDIFVGFLRYRDFRDG